MNFTLFKDVCKCKVETQFSGILQTEFLLCGSTFGRLIMFCMHEFRNVNTEWGGCGCLTENVFPVTTEQISI